MPMVRAHVEARGRPANLATWPIHLEFANSIRPFFSYLPPIAQELTRNASTRTELQDAGITARAWRPV